MISKIGTKIYRTFLETDKQKYDRKVQELEEQARILHKQMFRPVLDDLEAYFEEMKSIFDMIQSMNNRLWFRMYELKMYRIQ